MGSIKFDTVPSMKHEALSSATVSLLEYSIFYPFDMIKTRMMSLNPVKGAKYDGILNVMRKITADEGVRRFYRGMIFPLICSILAHSLYYFTYQSVGNRLIYWQFEKESPLVHATAAVIATSASNAVLNPAEVVKLRMQVYNSPYNSSLRCLSSIMHSEGLNALYRSLFAKIAIDGPSIAVTFAVFEISQNYMKPSRDFQLLSIAASGAVASALAASVTNPLDVCRTLLNTQESSTLGVIESTRIRGLAHAIRTVWLIHGFRGFSRGMSARIMLHTPSGALWWLMSEFLTQFYALKMKTK